MNPRIKQLLEEATEVYDYWQSGESRTVVDYKVFADLILFECIKLAVFKGDKATAQAIKEHFGVQ